MTAPHSSAFRKRLVHWNEGGGIQACALSCHLPTLHSSAALDYVLCIGKCGASLISPGMTPSSACCRRNGIQDGGLVVSIRLEDILKKNCFESIEIYFKSRIWKRLRITKIPINK
ncbi:hypothetical protein TNCV_176071 [Trichonephila clavipes]|nr:hypothetical protein TNCV_176071 [Trichonephila clavipes]